jgi:hypothetical protein
MEHHFASRDSSCQAVPNRAETLYPCGFQRHRPFRAKCQPVTRDDRPRLNRGETGSETGGQTKRDRMRLLIHVHSGFSIPCGEVPRFGVKVVCAARVKTAAVSLQMIIRLPAFIRPSAAPWENDRSVLEPLCCPLSKDRECTL